MSRSQIHDREYLCIMSRIQKHRKKGPEPGPLNLGGSNEFLPSAYEGILI